MGKGNGKVKVESCIVSQWGIFKLNFNLNTGFLNKWSASFLLCLWRMSWSLWTKDKTKEKQKAFLLPKGVIGCGMMWIDKKKTNLKSCYRIKQRVISSMMGHFSAKQKAFDRSQWPRCYAGQGCSRCRFSPAGGAKSLESREIQFIM